MILVAACFHAEMWWIPRRRGVRALRTPMGISCAEALEREWGRVPDVSLLISTGFSGGVDPELRVGDLLVADLIRYRDEEVPIDPGLREQARAGLEAAGVPHRIGPFASADHVLTSGEKTTRSTTQGIAVDMESGPLASWARDHGVAFLALRAVLDPAERELPFRAGRALWLSVLSHPLSSMRLAHSARIAGRSVGIGVGALLDELGAEV